MSGISVLSDVALEPALTPAATAFIQKDPFIRQYDSAGLWFRFGTPGEIAERVMRGDAADVVILPPVFIADLAATGKVTGGEPEIIGHVAIALAARADARPRDISTAAGLRLVLLAADPLILDDGVTGRRFAEIVVELGIDQVIAARVERAPRADVLRRVAGAPGHAVGVATVPEIRAAAGVRLLAPLPPEFRADIAYAAVPLEGASSPEAGLAFIRFLASPAAKTILAAAGVE